MDRYRNAAQSTHTHPSHRTLPPVLPPAYHCPPAAPQGPSANNEEYNTQWDSELEQALLHYANQMNNLSSTVTVAEETENVFQCMWFTGVAPCGEGFANLDDLFTHLGISHCVHGPANLRLNCFWLTNEGHLCGNDLRRDGFRRHISIHLGLRAACEVCGNSYSRADTLRRHLKEHEGA